VTVRLYVVVDGPDGSSRVVRRGPADRFARMTGPDILAGGREEIDGVPEAPGRETAVNVDLGAIAAGFLDGASPAGGWPRWNESTFGPHSTARMHRTPTLDYDLVTAGSIDLVLDAETLTLETGDAVILVAAHHGWQTHDAPATLLIAMTPVAAGA
jgi:hypothetical protein